jgi:hypothetical protein
VLEPEVAEFKWQYSRKCDDTYWLIYL